MPLMYAGGGVSLQRGGASVNDDSVCLTEGRSPPIAECEMGNEHIFKRGNVDVS